MSASGIYLPNGDFVDFAEARQRLTGEIATADRMGLGWASWFGALPDPDPILRKRGDDATILDEIAADGQVTMGMQRRMLKILNKSNYALTPGKAKGQDATPEAQRVCADLESDLEHIDLRDLFGEILEAPYYGLTVIELMWEPAGGRYKLVGAVPKPREWFGFNSDRKLILTEPGKDTVLQPDKFLTVRHRPTYNNPYGLRLLTRCLWPVAFKRGGVEFWARFCEKFGQPWIIAKGGENDAARRVMAGQLASMVQDAVAVFPANTDAQLVESSGKAGDLHKSYVQYWDEEIAKIILGGTLSTQVDGKGSYAAAQVHEGGADDLAEADEALLCTAMINLAAIYTRINAGPDVRSPIWGYEEPEDYAAKADLDIKLKGLGVKWRKEHMTNGYGLSESEFDMDETGQEQPGPDADPEGDQLDHAAPGDESDPYQADVDGLAGQLITEAAALNQKWAEQLQASLGKAETWEDLQILLAETLGQDLDTDEQSDLLTRAMLNAGLAGQAGVIDEEDADG